MSEDRLDYGEVLCEAVDTIISKKLENLAYDITKTCIVIDDTYKKQGRYTVADGALKFEAYSTITTLNINDNVLVSIPNGDYDNQKTILNKVIVDEYTSSLGYVSPLSNMLKFTDNIVNEVTPSALSDGDAFSILANDDTELEKLLYEFTSWEDYSGFSRLGISASFHTKLNQYTIISGNYGIKIKMYNGTSIRELDLNINDMIGNPYQFDTFFNQAKLFDISKAENINRVEVYLYQDNNFLDEFNQRLLTESDGDLVLGIPPEKIDNNILVNNIEIYLGYPLSDFNGDSVIISTPGYASYSKMDANKEKLLNLRWIHQVNENTYTTYTQKDIFRENLNIYWFRYTLNQTKSKDTEIAGDSNWSKDPSRIAQERDLDKFKSSFYPDYNNQQERIRAVCSIINDLGEEEYFRSNDLIFDNELASVDITTFNATKGLTIECLDNSDGNYFIYNQSGKIINEGKGQGYKRNFEVKFNGYSLSDEKSGLKNITSIVWTLPVDSDSLKRYTMLSYGEDQIGTIQQSDYDKGYIKLTKTKKNDFEIIETTQSYSIKNNWHSSKAFNLIKCEVNANGVLYETSLDLSFGKAGSSGSNITLVLEFDNNKNALVYDDENQQSVVVKALMYDMAGNKTSIPEMGWEWSLLNSDNSIILSEGDYPSQVKLTLAKNFDIMKLSNNFHVLKVEYKPEDSFSITTFLPIAIKSKRCDCFEGATEIIYDAQGRPNYYTDAYVLYGEVDGERQREITTNVNWALTFGENIIPMASLRQLYKNNTVYYALEANPIYIKNQENKLCIMAYQGSIENPQILWAQPIFITQSQYDYATLNEWNGSTSIVDKKAIMSSMIGVGTKTGDGVFSGVVIGDINSTEENDDTAEEAETTGFGIYGLTDGIITFSMTDKGIITFNGSEDATHGQVVLGNAENVIVDANGHYLLNLDKGFNSIIHNNGNERLVLGDENYNNYLSFSDAVGTPILTFTKDNYLIQSSNYSINNGLQIDLNSGGKLSINNNSKSLILNNSSTSALKIGDLNIDWDGGINQIKMNTMTLSSGNTSISIGDNLSIANNGIITYKGKDLETYIKDLIAAAKIPQP